MTKRILLGMLTPSSNTVLEPVTSAMVSGLPEVSAHFGRFRVTEISLKDQALGQFGDEPILEAARLLADARVDVIAWNGTSSGWLGFEADRTLCRRITEETTLATSRFQKSGPRDCRAWSARSPKPSPKPSRPFAPICGRLPWSRGWNAN
jgi:maleate cis-trans isomerase